MRALLVINAHVSPDTARDIAAGRSPRKDYFELQSALHADIIDLNSLKDVWWARRLERLLGSGIAQAVVAWTRARRYDAVFADRETTGFILAGLLQLRRRKPRLVLIGHILSTPKKQMVARALRVRRAIDCVIVHSSRQQQIATKALKLRHDQVALVPYQADECFWRPTEIDAGNRICSVGLEFRDYATLIDAVRDLDVECTVAAASHWSRHQGIQQEDLPANVTVGAFNYMSLRDLYAQSKFVVVPLSDVDNQAGITVILEAMAMGKAVIVSHSKGQVDVVRDRRRQSRTLVDRPTQADWLLQLGVTEDIAEQPTGMYVPPGDAAELRKAIQYLLARSDVAAQMGNNGRRVIEAGMSLDLFTQRVSECIRGTGAA